MIHAPISIGELYDKLTILEIKKEKITDKDKLINIIRENAELTVTALESNIVIDIDLYHKLKDVNLRLWQVEDAIRIKEKNNDFNEAFISLARSVYYLNDERSEIKREINLKFGSKIIEEKSYEKY